MTLTGAIHIVRGFSGRLLAHDFFIQNENETMLGRESKRRVVSLISSMMLERA